MGKVDRLRNRVEKVNPIICTAYSMLQYYTATEDVSTNYCTLLEKQSKFPCYNMKCRGKHDTT